MIQLSNISKEIGDRLLFSDVTFSLEKGEKVGLVGRNGSGKSTLFKIISGEIASDTGKITTPSNYTIGHLKQNLSFSHPTLIEECVSSLPDDEKFDVYKAEAILQGLGFISDDFSKAPSDFSGGYQIRISLTKILLRQNDLLLLDEPTNYLDIESITWLKNFLKKYPGEVITITHDRDFMNSISTSTIGLSRRCIEKVKGSTDKYFEMQQIRDEHHQNQAANQEKKKKQLEQFITRFKAKASKATAAQSRQKMLDKMEDFEELESSKSLNFRFSYKDFPGKKILETTNLSFGYDQNLLIKNLNFFINKGDRIAIIGKNGKGKSTLLNLIHKTLNPVEGEVKTSVNTKIGYFGQTHIQTLHMDNTIEEEIRSVNTEVDYSRVRSICGAMMFSGDDAKKKVQILSGGEKSRVLLGKILAQQSNLLLLDEPTNHLDQESVEELIESLNAFDGASVVVTHSEHILKKLPNKFIVFQKGSCFLFEGSYDDFIRKIGWDDTIITETKTEEKIKLTKKELRDAREEIIKDRSIELRPLEKDLQKCEEKIESLENKIASLNESLINTANDTTIDIGAVSVEHGKVSKELELLLTSYEDIYEKVENLSSQFELLLNDLEVN